MTPKDAALSKGRTASTQYLLPNPANGRVSYSEQVLLKEWNIDPAEEHVNRIEGRHIFSMSTSALAPIWTAARFKSRLPAWSPQSKVCGQFRSRRH